MTSARVVAASAVVLGLLAAALSKADLLQSSGKITFLRVHDVGTAFGPPSDRIDVEVVVHLNTRPGEFSRIRLERAPKRDTTGWPIGVAGRSPAPSGRPSPSPSPRRPPTEFMCNAVSSGRRTAESTREGRREP
jgi:hypothetical protein